MKAQLKTLEEKYAESGDAAALAAFEEARDAATERAGAMTPRE